MHSFLTENDIEQALLKKLEKEPFGYDILRCDASPKNCEVLPDGTGRENKKQCVLPKVLREALVRLNPDIPREKLEEIANVLLRDSSASDLISTNYRYYNQIRNGIQVSFRRNGKVDFAFARLMDFERPENNTFTAVSQMWIQGRDYWRRPDVLIFVNGLPMVFIELKNSTVKVEEAYNNNLKTYLKNIPNLFAFNQICVLSNGLETRLGAFNAAYNHFFEWLKVDSEKEHPNREAIQTAKTVGESSVWYFAEGLLRKERLTDYIENFIMFRDQKHKIIAKNHQYFGVNNLMESVKNRAELRGKLGVFWHTQGSGKSFSMVFFARKVQRKISGNFTFLVITDRADLDQQICKNFVKTGVIGPKEECQPKNGTQLREYLRTNKPFIFSLIQKFQTQKEEKARGEEYPLLSTRDDIIVLVDEAHRTEYKDLAENMRKALPNANYIAFTGTPLLGNKRLTNQWFGNYVSEYNFAQSIEDGSTVPLYYSRRVPEVWLMNDYLDEDVEKIVRETELNIDETLKLENSGARICEVIKRDDRLDKIAQDIARHFPRRGFLGKGMVVSVDKFTAIKMREKVKHYWEEEKKKLIQERNEAELKEKRDELTRRLEYMNSTRMEVIISEGVDQNAGSGDQEPDIANYTKEMEDRFKDPDDPFRLVFVCAMWLTGFDVENLSTLYLDKPMKGHSLMQAIARANRVYPGKSCGIIVDYVNVFHYMRQALAEYASGTDGSDFPAKDMDKLFALMNATVEEADHFLHELGIDLDAMLAERDKEICHKMVAEAFNSIISKEGSRERCKVILNTLMNLYEASRPESIEQHWSNEKFPPLAYLHGLFDNTVDDGRIREARLRMARVLDTSVLSQRTENNDKDKGYMIHQGQVVDLSKVNVDDLRKELLEAQYKAVEIDDLKAYLEQALKEMISQNCTRLRFSQRFRSIIDRYNSGSSENEEYYEQLLRLIEDMKAEERRPEVEGLTEEELEIFDLLIDGKKLSKAEEQKVKLSAKNLFKTLSGDKARLMPVDWYKDEQPRANVKSAIEYTLNANLPQTYDQDTFLAKIELLLTHFIDMAVQGYGWVAA